MLPEAAVIRSQHVVASYLLLFGSLTVILNIIFSVLTSWCATGHGWQYSGAMLKHTVISCSHQYFPTESSLHYPYHSRSCFQHVNVSFVLDLACSGHKSCPLQPSRRWLLQSWRGKSTDIVGLLNRSIFFVVLGSWSIMEVETNEQVSPLSQKGWHWDPYRYNGWDAQLRAMLTFEPYDLLINWTPLLHSVVSFIVECAYNHLHLYFTLHLTLHLVFRRGRGCVIILSDKTRIFRPFQWQVSFHNR